MEPDLIEMLRYFKISSRSSHKKRGGLYSCQSPSPPIDKKSASKIVRGSVVFFVLFPGIFFFVCSSLLLSFHIAFLLLPLYYCRCNSDPGSLGWSFSPLYPLGTRLGLPYFWREDSSGFFPPRRLASNCFTIMSSAVDAYNR